MREPRGANLNGANQRQTVAVARRQRLAMRASVRRVVREVQERGWNCGGKERWGINRWQRLRNVASSRRALTRLRRKAAARVGTGRQHPRKRTQRAARKMQRSAAFLFVFTKNEVCRDKRVWYSSRK